MNEGTIIITIDEHKTATLCINLPEYSARSKDDRREYRSALIAGSNAIANAICVLEECNG